MNVYVIRAANINAERILKSCHLKEMEFHSKEAAIRYANQLEKQYRDCKFVVEFGSRV